LLYTQIRTLLPQPFRVRPGVRGLPPLSGRKRNGDAQNTTAGPSKVARAPGSSSSSSARQQRHDARQALSRLLGWIHSYKLLESYWGQTPPVTHCGLVQQLPKERTVLHANGSQAAGITAGSGPVAVLFMDFIKTMHVSIVC
jgi:hypothetical protein